jgi:uncharacterized membrane protein YphA (DoxX/SURF4 family)
MLEALYPWMHLAGRILVAYIFVKSGIGHLTRFNATVGYAQGKGVPLAKFWVGLTGVMIIVGGLLVALGWHRFIGAGLLFLFLVPVAIIMHGFWKETDPMARAMEQVHFNKDIALAGASLLIAYYASWTWPLSLGG